jgi:hypothetical protein
MTALKHIVAGTVAVAALIAAGAVEARELQAPSGGQVHALVVGIDNYPHVRTLKGALADAADLESTLRRAGVSDVTRIPERQATRAMVVAGMERLVRQARPRDFVVIAFAGHGTQVPERVKNSKPDHLDEAYLLYDFDPDRKTPEMIIGPEMKHWLGQLEANGVDVLFIADTCYGGGMTRNWDPRSGELSYRSPGAVAAAAAAAAAANLSQTIAKTTDSFSDESTFKRVTFLAAVDKNTPAPEVDIPGQTTKRGALSYAVARAIDGLAGKSADGAVSRDELFGHARQTVLQYSNNRQIIVTEPAKAAGALETIVWRTAGDSPIVPYAPNNSPVGVAIVNGNESLSESDRIFTPFTVVGNASDADLVWDAGKKEALVAGDVIAQDIGASDIPAVVDRVRALTEIARLSAKSPQPIEVLPNNRLHYDGERDVTFKASSAQGKYAVLFNIAGDGTVQFLFPRFKDAPQIKSDHWQVADPPITVGKPYGSDTVVIVTSDQRLAELESVLSTLNGTRAAGKIPQLLATSLSLPPARLGFASLFTAAR